MNLNDLVGTGRMIPIPVTVNPDTINWLRGNPDNPEACLLIMYQIAPKKRQVDCEFYSGDRPFNVCPLSGKVTGETTDQCSLTLDNSPMTDFIRSQIVGRLDLYRRHSSDQAGKLHLDVAFVPHGVDKDLARNKILTNYVTKHLAKANYAIRLENERSGY